MAELGIRTAIVDSLGTVAESAAAELTPLPIGIRCSEWGTSWERDELPLACVACGSARIGIVGGDELVFESIEYRG